MTIPTSPEGRVPKRVQVSRRKGWRKPDNTVVVARPSKWGNPFAIGSHVEIRVNRPGDGQRVRVDRFDIADTSTAVALFRAVLPTDPRRLEAIRAQLAGKNLACWCPLDQPCHADVLLEIANR